MLMLFVNCVVVAYKPLHLRNIFNEWKVIIFEKSVLNNKIFFFIFKKIYEIGPRSIMHWHMQNNDSGELSWLDEDMRV